MTDFQNQRIDPSPIRSHNSQTLRQATHKAGVYSILFIWYQWRTQKGAEEGGSPMDSRIFFLQISTTKLMHRPITIRHRSADPLPQLPLVWVRHCMD